MNIQLASPMNQVNNQLSLEEFRKVLPDNQKNKLTQGMVDTINQLALDDSFKEVYKENLIGYTQVLNKPRTKITDYLNAVMFCSYHLLGCSKKDAYIKTFPDRYTKLISEGATDKTISSYVAMFAKNAMVIKILEQAMVPTHILNAPLYQEAINVQAELMRNAKSEKVRSDAADSLIRELRIPESAKIELEITTSESTIDDLRRTTQALAAQQKEILSSGLATAKDIAHSAIIEGEKGNG